MHWLGIAAGVILLAVGLIILAVLYIRTANRSVDRIIQFARCAAESYIETGHPTARQYVRIAAATVVGDGPRRELLTSVVQLQIREMASHDHPDRLIRVSRAEELEALVMDENGSLGNSVALRQGLSPSEFAAWRIFDETIFYRFRK